MSRIKLLIVCGSLAQAGNERWVYEICKNIDRHKFELSVLCDTSYLYVEKEHNYHTFYYHKIKKLNIEIYEYLEAFIRPTYWQRGVGKINRIFNKIFRQGRPKINSKIINLFKNSDVVCVIDTYNYILIKDVLHKWCENKFFIVLHSHKAQYSSDPYVCFDKNKQYNFTYFCPKQIEEINASGIDKENSSFYFNPLILDLSDYPNIFNPIQNQQIVISIFTRITSSKRIDNFIRAFAQIQNHLQDKCVLNIYGQIIEEDYHQDLKLLIANLGINEQTVRFMGHSSNIENNIKQDKVNIYWGLAINTSIGYSSIEIGAMGIPCIFWNFDEETDFNSILEQTNSLMFVHNEIQDFVATNLKYLRNKDLLSELSVKQRDYLINRHNVFNKIKDFEQYLISVIEQ